MEFNSVDVKEELLQFLKKGFKENAVRMNVFKSDPQTETELPCVGINRVSDSEAAHILGDFGGDDFDRDALQYSEIHSTHFQESMEVRIWHTNADERERAYRVMKALLMLFRPVAVSKGLLSFGMEAGKDESDFTGQVAPFPVYWASIIISYLNPLDVQVTERVEAISGFTVRGGVRIDG
ncbi:hypothetical protein [Paenibacillus polysaccharolyticus]|uniref:hypothetical protein n=1 Tax=Paenibacillus polysaccharolyticus TaxID=582692 RepID=UPI00280B271E|nr:hypothetical protein [Paenibacillus polysaccharolyticus]